MSESLERASWGRYPHQTQHLITPEELSAARLQDMARESKILPYGMGRSYGDSCLNSSGVLLGSRKHDYFLGFDPQSGILRAQSGVSFEEIIQTFLPRGWFLPVTPGTKFITLGGAVANDIHGKNHHHRGTFGRHVRGLHLWRTDRGSILCSPTENVELFQATIGGLGLTGFIDWVEIQMLPVTSAFWDVEVIKFNDLDEFLAIEKESRDDFEYTVSWIDGLSAKGRGHFIRGNACDDERGFPLHRSKLSIPFDFPSWALNPISIKGFNFAYYHRQLKERSRGKLHYDPFFYPLDGIAHWNRIYGRRGFLQYQFVIPLENAVKIMGEIMGRVARDRQASFLTVLKYFGDLPSPGMLSFPRPGLTYALDFPVSKQSFKLLNELDQIVAAVGGALYPAKDARMTSALFRSAFPRCAEFSKWIDPGCSSDFWTRVGQEAVKEMKETP